MIRIRRAMTGYEDGNVPCHMVYVDDLKAWLRAHQYPRSYNHTAHNGMIDDLLREIEDAEKEG